MTIFNLKTIIFITITTKKTWTFHKVQITYRLFIVEIIFANTHTIHNLLVWFRRWQNYIFKNRSLFFCWILNSDIVLHFTILINSQILFIYEYIALVHSHHTYETRWKIYVISLNYTNERNFTVILVFLWILWIN